MFSRLKAQAIQFKNSALNAGKKVLDSVKNKFKKNDKAFVLVNEQPPATVEDTIETAADVSADSVTEEADKYSDTPFVEMDFHTANNSVVNEEAFHSARSERAEDNAKTPEAVKKAKKVTFGGVEVIYFSDFVEQKKPSVMSRIFTAIAGFFSAIGKAIKNAFKAFIGLFTKKSDAKKLANSTSQIHAKMPGFEAAKLFQKDRAHARSGYKKFTGKAVSNQEAYKLFKKDRAKTVPAKKIIAKDAPKKTMSI